MFSLPFYQVVFVFVFIPFRETGSYDVDFVLFFERIPTSTGIFGFSNTNLSECWAFRPNIRHVDSSLAVLQSSYIIHSFPETLPFAALDLMWSPHENSDPHSRP